MNDLVKRLRSRCEYELIDGYKRIEWEDEDALEAADRIEELERALKEIHKCKTLYGAQAKAIRALGENK